MKNIYKEYFAFMKKAKNVYISSVDENNKPQISYSPCVVDDEKNVYILVSDLSKRTSSLVQGRNVSVMFIESEDQCEEIYVRILSQIGSPINIPQTASASVVLDQGVNLSNVSSEIDSIIHEELSDLDSVTNKILSGSVTLF